MAKTQIYQQQEALSVYFRDMLAEPGNAKPAVPEQDASESVTDAAQPITDPDSDIEQAAEQEAPIQTAPEPSDPAPIADTVAPITEAEVEHTQEKLDSTPAAPIEEANEVPSALKLLLCEMGGIKLALSVAELNNIVLWPEQGLHQLPGQADWQLGLLTQADQQVDVVDIRPALQAPESDSPVQSQFILLVDGRRRGIACDRIERIINVDNDAVNWRTDLSQRPWFTGVIADSMHNIIDLPALLSALSTGEMA